MSARPLDAIELTPTEFRVVIPAEAVAVVAAGIRGAGEIGAWGLGCCALPAARAAKRVKIDRHHV